MTLCVLNFYQYSSPRGFPLKQLGEWTTSSTSSVVIAPPTNQIYFVKSISFLLDNTTDFGSHILSITHSTDTFGGVESTSLSYSSVNSLISGFSPGTTKTMGCQIKGHIVFDVPMFFQNSTSESLTISFSGSGLSAGQLDFVASGWWINSADL